jgi:transcriptional regulator with XRE-family HTH domain
MISDHKKEYQEIAVKLRAAREECNLKQGRAAHNIDKSQSYISKVESGAIFIGAVELNMLAKVYKKSVEYFFEM